MELWLPDGASYLADLRHPLARRELEVLQKAQGLPYNHTMSDRERREFDRRMIRKYGGAFRRRSARRGRCWRMIAWTAWKTWRKKKAGPVRETGRRRREQRHSCPVTGQL